MMLSRGLIQLKLKEYAKNDEKNIINIQSPKNTILDIKEEILTLFYDGKLPYDKIRSNFNHRNCRDYNCRYLHYIIAQTCIF